MQRCVICEGLLEDSQFAQDSPICYMCVTRLNNEFNVEYSPPERPTRKEAVINLIIAIHTQAFNDERKPEVWSKKDREVGGPLQAWRKNWVEDLSWRRLWDILLEEQSHSHIGAKQSAIHIRV